MRVGVWAVLVSALAVCVRGRESFDERLDLQTLPGGRVHAAFAFTLTSDDASLLHFQLLPRALLQPVGSLDVDAMQLSLTAGRWHYDTWGAPASTQAVASGAEVWASFRAQSTMPLATRWRRLTSALAGLFCTSLDAVDNTTSTSIPASYVWSDAPPNATALHAYLPSEAVCTENITPILKLLPCQGGAGLASLIQPHAVLSSEFHSVSVRVLRTGHGYTTEIAIEMVARPPRISSHGTDWTFASLFARSLQRACPVATSSAVHLSLPHGTPVAPEGRVADEIDLLDAPLDPFRGMVDEHVYDTRALDAYDGALSLSFHANAQGPFLRTGPLHATRQVLGYGQERNVVRLTLRNDLPAETITLVYYEQLPWVVFPLMHTMDTSLALHPNDEPDTVHYRADYDTPFVTNATYRPSSLRHHTGSLELALRVPSKSTLTVTYTIVKRVLHYAEHVPDPHRGIDVPPALFIPTVHGRPWAYAHRGAPVHAVQAERIYSVPSLLDIAVPDFSMPYNIVLFYSTVVALFFGSLLNLMVRKYYDVVVG